MPSRPWAATAALFGLGPRTPTIAAAGAPDVLAPPPEPDRDARRAERATRGDQRGARRRDRSGGRADGVRPEIQALRALAVSLVVIYHLWPKALPGGFVGVDVFFAISGFLITSHLLREVDRTGTVRLLEFWARRARRILPAALLVLAICAVATMLWVPENYWQQYIEEIRASTAYVENWYLADAAVDYLAAENAPSPVQHFWSLSAEEQFYLVWPVLIVIAALPLLARSGRKRRSIAIVLGAVAVASLVYAISYTASTPARAFFVTPTRAWEFALGGLLGLVPLVAVAPALRRLVSWLGLAAVMVAALAYSGATPWPGYAALLPVLGTVAVMWAGAPRGALSPTPLLSIPPIQFLGNISYSVYLWHWPLLILLPIVTGDALTLATKVAIIVATIVLAWLTKVLVEDPVRAGPLLARRRARWTFASVAAATGIVFALTAMGTSTLHARERLAADRADRVLAERPRCFGAASHDPQKPCVNRDLRLSVVPKPVIAANRPNAYCKRLKREDLVSPCAFGVPEAQAKGRIAVIGDSHAAHLRAAIAVVAKERGWYGISITRKGCPLTTATKRLPELEDRAQCVEWNRQVQRWIRAHPEITIVFLAQINGDIGVIPTKGRNGFDSQVAGYAEAWAALPATVERIYVFKDTPRVRATTMACVQKAIDDGKPAVPRCSVPVYPALRKDPGVQAAREVRASNTRIRLIDLNPYVCDKRTCPPVIGGALVYKDNHHFTEVFATTLGPYLRRELDTAERRS